MFPFDRDPKDSQPAAAPLPVKASEPHPLDGLTGGVFSASTSGERTQKLREWLGTEPAPEQMHEVFKELSAKDKGAARVLREKLDELRRAREQDALAEEWCARAQVLLDVTRLNIADALAWQRDAAKAGAPLSREPLAGLRARLAERVKAVEDLQQRLLVQREAAALLAQRIELLSTRSWIEARAQQEALHADLQRWRAEADAVRADVLWPSVDLRYPPQLEAAQTQIDAVWSAFVPALEQAVVAAADAVLPLPPVPVWADQIRSAREQAAGEAALAAGARPAVDPELRAVAGKTVEAGVRLLEQAVAAGHTKSMNSAVQALRQSLKLHGRLLDEALAARVNMALVSAGQLEGWQRWSADKAREQLVVRAEALLERRPSRSAPPVAQAPAVAATDIEVPPAATDVQAAAQEGAESAQASGQPRDEELVPVLDGRRLQEAIRKLREEWKTADQGGPPNHVLWKRFDRACNAAHRFVDQWLERTRAEAAGHKAQRTALITEVQAWSVAQQAVAGADWKAASRQLHQFSDRWRKAGHLAEKAYAELQAQWKAAMQAAAAPLEAEQKASTARRQALIAEAQALVTAPQWRIDAVRQLQQRWQAEAQAVPLDRRQEQKLWDAFRQPIDEAFNRRGAERERQQAALSAHDQVVLQAARELQAANASGEAGRIRVAMAQLEAASRGQLPPATLAPEEPPAPAASPVGAPVQDETAAADEGGASGEATGAAQTARPSARPVRAMRGDDRPQGRLAQPVPERAGRDGGGRGERRDGLGGRGPRTDARGGGRFDARPPRDERGPRLGDAAFRAQRNAVESAQEALRKLAAQAHGAALGQLISAWRERQDAQVPAAPELGRGVTAAQRNAWAQAIAGGAASDEAARAATALLRLEMAAEVATPPGQLEARRALQLQLLTRRNDPTPAQTWQRDVADVLVARYDEAQARRLQNVLGILLRRS